MFTYTASVVFVSQPAKDIYNLHYDKYHAIYDATVAEQSNARVCGCSFAGIAGSNPAGGLDVCLL